MPLSKRRPTDAPAVIVIEDDLDARRFYADYLRSKGWNVFTAQDGRAGLNKALELTPDVILLDLAMPRVDGWTVLKQIRESSATAHIAVVVVSALSNARDKAFQAGCDAYLMKPCSPEIVYLQLRALLRLKGIAASI